MSAPFGQTTGPEAASTADHVTTAPWLALVIVWSKSQPERVGDIAFFPRGERLYLGRDGKLEKFAQFVRQLPGEMPAVDLRDGLLTGESISREQLTVCSTGIALEVEKVGRCRTFVNGEERERATIRPGDTVMLKGELLLLCVVRPRMLPRPRGVAAIQAFGEPDAAGIVGESPAAWLLREQIAQAAPTGDHVLVLGESGTGKELAATAIHDQSRRKAGPFISRNASTFPATLLASELFGNRANYPNPGMPAAKGLVGAADRGTLFLDEIGDFPRDAQVQMLRVLDEGEYQSLGEATMRRADVRVVGATNLDESVFRGDFFARFLGRVRVPPLRERQEDIPLLIRHLLLQRAQACPDVGRFFAERPDGRLEPRLSGRLVDYLVRHPLRTNVRELHRFLVQAAEQSDGDTLRLPAEVATSTEPPAAPAPTAPTVGQAAPGLITKEQLVACLDRERGNVARVARVLRISRSAVYRLMESYGIERPPVD
jgi:DNA-binding NtrC family response regulator